VNAFRDRVYIMSDYQRSQPESRLHYGKIVGFKTWALLFLNFSLPFGWIAYWLFTDPAMLVKGWQLFTLPLVVYGFAKTSLLMQAIMEHQPKSLDRLIQSELAYQDPQTWREAFPDKALGITILRAYEMEKEARMRYLATINGVAVPATTMDFHHPSFPPYP